MPLDIFTRTISRLGLPEGKLGNVVVLPGVLGTDLEDQTGRDLWIFPPELDELALAPNGVDEAVQGRTVHPAGANFPYAALVQVLQLSWNVLVFGYDWRKDLNATAARLDEAAKRHFNGERFHVVAHSMGGLAARLHRARFPQSQGRLVMLGTPNHGSFLAIQALTVDMAASAFLRLFGVTVPPGPAMAAARTWPGAYQLLPSPLKAPEVVEFYRNPPSMLSRNHVDAAARFHTELDTLEADDDMFYIGGSHIPTHDGAVTPTLQGDGVVSHRLGFLSGTKTFTVLGGHVELPSNPLVLASITSLLHSGRAPLLK